MLILGIDTTTKTASAAVVSGGKTLAEMTADGNISHSENLMPMIDYTLKCAGAALSDIDLFAVSCGPGSFTGIRIGVATIKGLAFGSESNNCAGVSSLLALAYNFRGLPDPSTAFGGPPPFTCNECEQSSHTVHANQFKGGNILILPVIDARRKQVYNAVFDGDKYIKHDRIITVGELEEELNREFSGHRVIFAGDGAEMCCKEIDFAGKVQIPEMLKSPSAASVCAAAYMQYSSGGAIHARALAPSYIIKTQAEREYGKK